MNVPELYNYGHGIVTTHDNNLVHMFRKYLLQKAISVFKWNVPETWSKDYFLYCLYCNGFVAVVNTTKYGVIPQHCALSGYDIFYRPNTAVISNPLLNGFKELRIGTQCTLFKLNPDYSSILDLVYNYADIMALCAQTAGVNLLNSNLSYVFAAKNKAAAETFKKMVEGVVERKPAIAVSKDLWDESGNPLWSTFSQNLRQNYIAGDLLSDLRKWEQLFDTEIGIPNANTDKKERLITDEVNANNVETATKCEMWLENLKKVCEQTNAMFPGTNISVDWRVKPNIYGGVNNGNAVNGVRSA